MLGTKSVNAGHGADQERDNRRKKRFRKASDPELPVRNAITVIDQTEHCPYDDCTGRRSYDHRSRGREAEPRHAGEIGHRKA